MALHADAIYALLRPFSLREIEKASNHAFLLEIDGDCAACFCHAEAVREAIYRNHLSCAEQDGAADSHLPYRAAAPDCDGVVRFDVTMHSGLPAGRQNVAQEQCLIVGQAIRHFDVGRIGEGHPHVLRLHTWIASSQVRVAEQACSRVAEDLFSQMFVSVGSFAYREVAAQALLALAADDRKWYDDALPFPQPAVHS